MTEAHRAHSTGGTGFDNEVRSYALWQQGFPASLASSGPTRQSRAAPLPEPSPCITATTAHRKVTKHR
jgi:hypothetical protein